jgi:hypothetical protein
MGKMKSIYKALLNKNEKILERKEIIKKIKEYNDKIEKLSIPNTLWYLSRNNYIKRIFLDYYYINSIEERDLKYCKYPAKDLLFLVLNKIKIKWYLGLVSAKYTNGKIWQTPNITIIINNKFSGTKIILKEKIKFIKIKDSLFFGLKNLKTEKGIKYSYSNKEKTSLDELYLYKNKKLILNKKTKEYLEKYPKWLKKLK